MVIGKLSQKLGFMGAGLIIAGSLLFATIVQASSSPYIAISNASAVEGDTGLHQINFNVTLSAPATTTVTAKYLTFDDWEPYGYGKATGVPKTTSTGGDYVTKGGTLTFNPGQVVKDITIAITPDQNVEFSEHFSVVLYDPVGATLSDAFGTGTIIDDDTASGFWSAIGDASIREGNTKTRTVDVMVSFSNPAPANFTITTSTVNGTATGGANANGASADFVSQTKTVTVTAGTRFKIVTITIVPNVTQEQTETFYINLTASYGTVIKNQSIVQIRDDDMTYNRVGRTSGPPRVALMGDSITAGYSSTAKTTLEAQGYAVWPHGQPGTGILDADKCQGQWATSVLNAADPDIVVFENIANYGLFPSCNPSVAYKTPQFYADWQTSAQQQTDILTSQGAKFFWIINHAPSPEVPRYEAVLQINPIYQQITNNTPNAFAIDAWTAFGGDPADPGLLTADGVHLTQAGENIMTDLVNAAINQ